MKIHVLGGEGFVGSAFVRVGRTQGHQIQPITRRNYARFCGKPCDLLVNANGNSRKYLADRDPAAEFDASVVSTQRSLLDFPCQRYVFLSSIDVYERVDEPKLNHEKAVIRPETLSRYGLHKFLAEQLVRKYARHWLIIRMGGMVGQGLWKNAIFDLLHGKPLRVHLDSEYQYVNTDAVARIVLRLVRKAPANDVFNVCGQGCLALRKVAAQVPGCRPKYAVERPAVERYEINITKLARHMAVPRTSDTVHDFVSRQLE